MRDDNNEKINLERFTDEYQLSDVFGRIVPTDELIHYLFYDEETGYFVLDLTTIGPRFSFALYHKKSCMAIYLPFVRDRSVRDYYAVDIKFKEGVYLFDFEIKNKEKLFFKSNMPCYVVDNINWKKQSRKFSKSEYKNDKTYNLKPQ